MSFCHIRLNVCSNSYIITGANRGLGLEFVRQLSTHPSTTIIACVRSLTTTDLTALHTIKSHPTTTATLTIHELLTSSPTSIASLPTTLPSPSNLPTPLILLNNAGINSHPSQSSLTLDAPTLHTHMDVNVLGPAFLTHALLASGHLSQGSLVFNMTSGMGSLGKNITGDAKTTYAISKVALNMLARHQAKDLEEKGVKVLVMDPGWVKTDMGGPRAVLEQDVSISGMLKVVEKVLADDSYLGQCKFFQYDGQEVPW